MHRTVAAALVAMLALALASCGSTETLSRAELVRRINVACRVARQQVQARARSSRTQATFLSAVLDDQRIVLERISGLHPTAASKADFEAFKENLKQRIDLFARVAAAARRGPAATESAIRSAQSEGEALTSRLNRAAARLGVVGCI